MPHSTITENTTVDGKNVEIVSLETIDFGRLAANEPSEIEKLVHASQMPGFFYLDLQNEASKDVLVDLQEVYKVSEQHFGDGPAIKMQDIEIARDKMLRGTLSLPPKLSLHTSLLERLSTSCHHVTKTMLSTLSSTLHLPEVEIKHRGEKPSDTALDLIYAPTKERRADMPDTTHTDTGTMTILFCEKWGNMLEHPETKTWAYIPPKVGCGLVNVADSLTGMSGGKLHSCRHAVTQMGDGFEKRYFVVYYLRPEKLG